ncbi:MAG: carbohydrate-binding family 9-like protein [Flavobacteriaceae bacterium]
MEEKSLKHIKIGSLVLFLLYVGSTFMAAQEAPRKYTALRAIEALHIDGKADEPSWKNAEWSADFIDIEGVIKPSYKTQMKMLWDDTYLYFFAHLKEPHVWGTLKQRDTVIFYNNDFEIFIDSDGDTHNYMEFEVNTLNTVWDLFLTKPYRNHGKVLNSWDIQGLKTAVHIEGTLNDPKDTDTGWSVEIAIPWAVITQASNTKALPENEFWRINFSRVNWQYNLKDGSYFRKQDKNGKYLPEYNWVWSPQGVINMHEPEHWGYVYFSTKESESGADFEIPKDDYIKWYMYGLYRKLLQSEANFETVKKEVLATSKIIFGEEIKLQVDMHLTGWSIFTKSPFTKKTMVIKEDGKFLNYEK